MTRSVIPDERRLPGIHALRGAAALAVLLFHLHHLSGLALPGPLRVVGTHFALGVTLFFVLSAFSLLYSTDRTVGRDGWVRDYFVKRAARIAPLFYAMVALYTLLALAVWHTRVDPWNLGLNALFIFNFVPGRHESIVWAGWTVGVEMVFYAVLPLALVLTRRLRVTLAAYAVTLFASYVARTTLEALPEPIAPYSNFAFVSLVGLFFAGVVAYRVYERLREHEERWRGRLRIAFPLVTLALLAFLFSPAGDRLVRRGRPDHLVWALLAAVVCVWQVLYPARWFANAFLQHVGERSYSVYLLHPLVVHFLSPVNKKLYAACASGIGAWAFLVCGAFTGAVLVGLSEVTYRAVEVPGIALGARYVAARRAARRAEEEGAASRVAV